MAQNCEPQTYVCKAITQFEAAFFAQIFSTSIFRRWREGGWETVFGGILSRGCGTAALPKSITPQIPVIFHRQDLAAGWLLFISQVV